MLDKYTDKLWEGFTDIVNLKYVYFKNEALENAFLEADLKMKGIANEKGIDSPEFRAQREIHKKELSKRVRSLLIPEAA